LKIFKSAEKHNLLYLNTVLPKSFKLSGMTCLDAMEFCLELMKEISVQSTLFLERAEKLKQLESLTSSRKLSNFGED
jgi:hypothetical protein